MTPANSVHLAGNSDEGFASVVKKKKKKKKKKMMMMMMMMMMMLKTGNLRNLGKHQKQASYARSQ